jgi:hypothetical protein
MRAAEPVQMETAEMSSATPSAEDDDIMAHFANLVNED